MFLDEPSGKPSAPSISKDKTDRKSKQQIIQLWQEEKRIASGNFADQPNGQEDRTTAFEECDGMGARIIRMPAFREILVLMASSGDSRPSCPRGLSRFLFIISGENKFCRVGNFFVSLSLV